MPAFAKVSAPLRALTKKNATFLWTAECETAFIELKRLLTTAPVLTYPRFGPDRSFLRQMPVALDWVLFVPGPG